MNTKDSDSHPVDASSIRAMVEFYTSMRDERVKAMLTLQGLLFAALGFSWGKDSMLTVLLAIVGTIASGAFSAYLAQPDSALKELHDWWHRESSRSDEYSGPPLFPKLQKGSRLPDPINFFVCAVGMAWGGILILGLQRLCGA